MHYIIFFWKNYSTFYYLRRSFNQGVETSFLTRMFQLVCSWGCNTDSHSILPNIFYFYALLEVRVPNMIFWMHYWGIITVLLYFRRDKRAVSRKTPCLDALYEVWLFTFISWEFSRGVIWKCKFKTFFKFLTLKYTKKFYFYKFVLFCRIHSTSFLF